MRKENYKRRHSMGRYHPTIPSAFFWRSLSANQPYNKWQMCEMISAREGILWVNITLRSLHRSLGVSFRK